MNRCVRPVTNRIKGLLVFVAVVVAIVVGISGPTAGAGTQSGPSITLDRAEVRTGDPILVTLTGFTSQQATVAVCGNLAKRGASDCNMPQAQSERIRPDQVDTLTQLFVEAPPVPCPCVVRALGTDGEFAIALIDVIGHPTGPLTSPEFGELVDIGLTVAPVDAGLSRSLRSELGGATAYAATVSIRNISTETLERVAVRARVSHRLDDEIAPMQFDVPGPIDPGQTWTQTIEVEVPAPFIGRYTWSAVVSGAGPSVEAERVTDAVPVALIVLVAILLLDIVVLVIRAIVRRRRRRRSRPAAHHSPPTGGTVEYVDEREPAPVG